MPGDGTEERKRDHIRICLNEDVSSEEDSFSEIHLIHDALPEADFGEIDISTVFLGKRLNYPFIVTGMIGGTDEAERINRNIAWACQRTGIAMGVGSQRAMIERPELVKSYSIREEAPDILLLGNIGAVQLVKGYGVDECKRAMEMIKADGLALHLNSAQELCQKEGDTNWKGVEEKIKEVCSGLGKPVIVKEVGAGISMEAAKRLEAAGAAAIDVSGKGGTSWSYIESFRSEEKTGEAFRHWGIPTSVALIECRSATGLPLIASGGMRTGIQAAKALTLGADLVGFALPVLKAASESREAALEEIERLAKELKTAVMLTGSKSLSELREKPIIITGTTREYLRIRGIDTDRLARR